MSKPLEKAEAIRMRKSGKSLRHITKALGVSQGTVSYWCRAIELTEEQKAVIDSNAQESQARGLRKSNETVRRRAIERRETAYAKAALDVGSLSDRDLFMLGLGLYWGEGSKRGVGSVGMINMDPNILKLYVQWLSMIGIDKKELRAKLVIAPGLEVEDHKQWWMSTLGIDATQFTKTMVKVAPTSKRKTWRPDYHGMLLLTFSSVKFHSYIIGMIRHLSDVPVF